MNVIAFRSKEHIAAEARAAELPDRRASLDPTNPLVSSPLGRAHMRGLISKDELNAGQNWGKVHSEYIETIKNPDAYTDRQCEFAADEYQKGIEILNRLPKRVFHAVMALAAYGEDWGDLEYTAAAAKIGLKELPQKLSRILIDTSEVASEKVARSLRRPTLDDYDTYSI